MARHPVCASGAAAQWELFGHCDPFPLLGIGASLAIFTVTDNLLLRPLPYRDTDRLTMVWERNMRQAGEEHNVVSPGNYLDWKRQNDVFESMAGFRVSTSVLTVGSRASSW